MSTSKRELKELYVSEEQFLEMIKTEIQFRIDRYFDENRFAPDDEALKEINKKAVLFVEILLEGYRS